MRLKLLRSTETRFPVVLSPYQNKGFLFFLGVQKPSQVHLQDLGSRASAVDIEDRQPAGQRKNLTKLHSQDFISIRADHMGAPRPCMYRKFPDDVSCPSAAFYLLELISRQGPRSQVTICQAHVHKAWEFGQDVLDQRFPKRSLKLAAVRLMPILQPKSAKKNVLAKRAGADS